MPKDKTKKKTPEQIEAERRREEAKMEAERLMPVRVGENKNMRRRRRRQERKLHRELRQQNSSKKGSVDFTTKMMGQTYKGEEKWATFREETTEKVSNRMIKSGVVNPGTGLRLDKGIDRIVQNHTHYFRGEEAKKKNVSVKDGKLVDVNGRLLDTRGSTTNGRQEGMSDSFIFAMNKHGQLRSTDSKPILRPIKSGMGGYKAQTETPSWLWRMQEPERPTRPGSGIENRPGTHDEDDGGNTKQLSNPGGGQEQEQQQSDTSTSASKSTSETSIGEQARRAREQQRQSDDDRAQARLKEAKSDNLSSAPSRSSYTSDSYWDSQSVHHSKVHHGYHSSYTESSYTDSQDEHHDEQHHSAEDSRRTLSEGSRERRFSEKLRKQNSLDKMNQWSFGWMNHSSLFAGDEVAGAGELRVEDGELTGINNVSGHYRPGEKQLWQTVNYLHEQGLPMERTTVSTLKRGNEKLVDANALRMLAYGNEKNRGRGFVDHIKKENSKKDRNVNDVFKNELGGSGRQKVDDDSVPGVSLESGLVSRLTNDNVKLKSGGNLLNTKSGMLRHVDPSQINDRSAPNLKLPGEQTDLVKPQQPQTEIDKPPQPQTTAPSVAPRGKSELIMQRIAELSGQKLPSESKPGVSMEKTDQDTSNLKIAELKERLKKAGLKI